MKNWKDKLSEAQSLDSLADSTLQEAMIMLLSDKGVDNDIIADFSVSFATGSETVVHYNNDEGVKSGLSDLDLTVMAGMCVEEIYEYFGIEV